MPYKRLLEDLMRSVPGAEAAILLDSEGEVVVEAGARDMRHRLIGAYQGIALATARRTMVRCEAGDIEAMICRYSEAALILRPLKDGYFFVLALSRSASVAEALFRSDFTRALMQREI